MSKKQQLDKIERDMENWLPKTGNMRELLKPVAESSSQYLQTTDNVYQSLIIDTATDEEIENIGSPLGVYRNTDESVDVYRARVESAYRQIINNGSPKDIIESVSLILNISEKSIQLENNDGVSFTIVIPLKSLQQLSISKSELEDIINRLAAATYNISIVGSGTLDYITPSEYNTGTTEEGYADSENEIESIDRGTYSEVID